MGTMNISLPDEMKRFVDQQVREGDYAGSSDYMRALIRKERDVAKLRAMLQEGLDSGPAEPVTDAWFDALRRRLRARARKTG